MSGTKDTQTLDRKILGQLQEMDRLTGRGTLEKIVKLFLGSMPERLDALERAVKSRDFQQTRRLTHTMKSSAGNLGAMKLSAYCRSLEELDDQSMISESPALLTSIRMEYDAVKAILLQSGILQP